MRKDPLATASKILVGCIIALVLLKIAQVLALGFAPNPVWDIETGRLHPQNTTLAKFIDYTDYQGTEAVYAGFAERLDDLAFYNAIGAAFCCWFFLAARSRLRQEHIILPQVSAWEHRIALTWVVIAMLFYVAEVFRHQSDINGTFFAQTDYWPVRTIQWIEGVVHLLSMLCAYVPLWLGLRIRRLVEDLAQTNAVFKLKAVPELIMMGIIVPVLIVFSGRIFFVDLIIKLQNLGKGRSAETVIDSPAMVATLTALWYFPYLVICALLWKDLIKWSRIKIEFKMPPISLEPLDTPHDEQRSPAQRNERPNNDRLAIGIEPSASPNGGPASSVDNSITPGGPPSVS